MPKKDAPKGDEKTVNPIEGEDLNQSLIARARKLKEGILKAGRKKRK
jgi:hypothetical protein